MENTYRIMNPTRHMFSYINQSVRDNWKEPAFSDFHKDVHYSFGEAATLMARLGLLFERLGVAPGRSSAHAVAVGWWIVWRYVLTLLTLRTSRARYCCAATT